MPSNFETVKDIMNNVEGYIEQHLKHVYSFNRARGKTNKIVLSIKKELYSKVNNLIANNNLDIITASKICGLSANYFYFIKRDLYARVSENKCEVIIERLQAFETDHFIVGFEKACEWHKKYRENEIVTINKKDIFVAIEKEIRFLMKEMQMSFIELRKISDCNAYSLRLISFKANKNVTVKKALCVLLFVRKLKDEGFAGKKRIIKERREALYNKIIDTIDKNKISLRDLIHFDIITTFDGTCLRRKTIDKISLVRLSNIANTIDQLCVAIKLI